MKKTNIAIKVILVLMSMVLIPLITYHTLNPIPQKITVLNTLVMDYTSKALLPNKPANLNVSVITDTLGFQTLEFEYSFSEQSAESFCFLFLVDEKEIDKRNMSCQEMVNKKLIYQVPIFNLYKKNVVKIQTDLISSVLQKNEIELVYK